jgi:hypothetical protein
MLIILQYKTSFKNMIWESKRCLPIGNSGLIIRKREKSNRNNNEVRRSKNEELGNLWRWSWRSRRAKLRLSRRLLPISWSCSFRNGRARNLSSNWTLRICHAGQLRKVTLTVKFQIQLGIKIWPTSLLKSREAQSQMTPLWSRGANLNLKMSLPKRVLFQLSPKLRRRSCLSLKKSAFGRPWLIKRERSWKRWEWCQWTHSRCRWFRCSPFLFIYSKW